MEWLNYHHLRYFWTVAKEGSLAAAAAVLNVSQPSISGQVRELEEAMGEKLFQRVGRKNQLTDAGQIAFGYAEEIFAAGSEMMNAVKQRPGAKVLRLNAGIVDSLPKLIVNDILRPVLAVAESVHAMCHEGKLQDLLPQLAVHRLDLILADEPASSSVDFKVFSRKLGATGTTFCAERSLASRLKKSFPKSLHGAPALLPAENTPFRRSLESWFRAHRVKPRVVVECEDLALMKVMASEGRGFIALPSSTVADAARRFDFQPMGEARRCRVEFYGIATERRIAHPLAAKILGPAAPAS